MARLRNLLPYAGKTGEMRTLAFLFLHLITFCSQLPTSVVGIGGIGSSSAMAVSKKSSVVVGNGKVVGNDIIQNTNETEAIEFLSTYNEEIAKLINKASIAEWNYNTNLTDENAEAAIEAGLILSEYGARAFENASQFEPENFSDDTKRQLSRVGSRSISDDEMKTLSFLISEMGSIYGRTNLCRPKEGSPEEECLFLEPGLTALLSESRNVSERLWAWEGWHRIVGGQIKPFYVEYVKLKNKLARVNGYEDYGDQLRQKYEDDAFESDIRRLYEEMKPLYLELHAYIRRKLYETYGSDVVDINGTLGQHLLGDMWGRFWVNLYSIAVPYPGRPSMDVTEAMRQQNYTVRRMFDTGEDFYTSMGLKPLPSTFFNLSMLERPTDGREVVCHATAWDFMDGEDFRIKMCTNINMEDLLTIHHELGHIQYDMQYAHLPAVYRDGANDGFHEAVGELMSMCVSTPKHLYAIGLLDELPSDNETEINYLLKTALSTVSALPFHYLNDLWRWKAFRGEFPERLWNDEFWNLSEEIVGVHPPAVRTSEDLDCPTIFHVAQDYDMIRYFCRTILQFQFAESLCEAAGHEGPLSECDFYGSHEAGDKLADMLMMGSSKPWPEALEALTGQRSMNAIAIRNYFAPLENWLRETNARNGDTPGWTTSGGKTITK